MTASGDIEIRPALPRGVSVADQVYLRPLPEPAAGAPEGALPLGGGPLAFAACELILRRPDRSIRIHRAPVEAIRRWAEGEVAPAVGDRVGLLLQRLAAPRQAIAGVSFERPRLMGVLNITPDSFSDGGRFLDPDAAVAHGRALIAAGADILDLGGESTRPGATPVAPEEEARRVLPVLRALARETSAPLSIDTRQAAVMRQALEAGARIINDVSALTHDPEALSTVAASGAPAVLMHAQGEPATMQRAPRYDRVTLDVYDALEARIEACGAAGIARSRLLVDPGIGFGKNQGHNLTLLRDLALLHGLGCPLLLGVSRKSFIGRLGGGAAPEARLPGSLAAGLWGIAQGAQILRVHDVAETRQALDMWQAMVATTPFES